MKADIDLMELGQRIKHLRLAKGLSQDDVAQPAFTPAYMSHVENGKRRPSHSALTHIAERLDVSVEQLLSGRDPAEDLRLEIEIQSAVAAIHRGEAAEARRRLEEAGNRARRLNHARAILRADEGLGLALYQLGDLDEALRVFKRASVKSAGAIPEERTSVTVGLARCLFQNGETPEALHLLEAHLQELLGTDAPDPTSLLQVYGALIPPYYESGLLSKAMDVASRGWRLTGQVGDPEGRGCLYVNRAGLLLAQGETREAMASLALAEDQFRQLGWHGEIVKVSVMRALVLIEGGDGASAERLLTDVLSEHADAVSKTDHAQALTHLCRAVRLQGRQADGLRLANKALQLCDADLPAASAYAAREAGMCAAALGDRDSALGYWRQALELFRELGNRDDSARTARLIGDVLLEEGDTNAAASAYREGLLALGELR